MPSLMMWTRSSRTARFGTILLAPACSSFSSSALIRRTSNSQRCCRGYFTCSGSPTKAPVSIWSSRRGTSGASVLSMIPNKNGRPSSNGILSTIWPPPPHGQQQQRRHYTPMTPEEEEKEKARVSALSEFQKDQELRKLNRQIARLEKFKGINTGELYTWHGRYKALARDYGLPLVAWYWACWTGTAILCYGAITFFHVDTVALLAQVDAKTGWSLVERVDPEMGKIGMTILVNELIEPLRLPVVIVTCKPVVDRVAPPKF